MSNEKLFKLSSDFLSEDSALLLNKYMVENAYLKASLAIKAEEAEKATESYIEKSLEIEELKKTIARLEQMLATTVVSGTSNTEEGEHHYE